MEVTICNPKTRDCILQKLVNNAYNTISALVFLAIPVVFEWVLYRISCRIEWFLFQVHRPNHAEVIILILACYHKATIVALQSQRGNTVSIYTLQRMSIQGIIFAAPRRAPGFLQLLLSANVCVFMCVCVSAPEAMNN